MVRKVYDPEIMKNVLRISTLSDEHIRWNTYKVLRQSTPAEVEGGKVSYFDYHKIMHEIGKRYGVSHRHVAGVFCALSPNADWLSNLRSALTVVHGFVNSWAEHEVTVSTYKHNRAKAWELMAGAPFDEVYKGLKVRAFYRNICDPNDREHVCVDGHMANVARGYPVGTRYAETGGIKGYRRIVAAVKEVAEQEGLIPSQLQGILWVTWKRIHGIMISDHASLFDALVEWKRPYIDTSNWRPYPRRVQKNEKESGYVQECLCF